MSSEPAPTSDLSGPPSWLPALATVVSLVGLADSIYLTVHHFTAEPVPCSVTGGCEQVLSSSYSELMGVPLAAFGAAAYFIAFCLALFTAFGNGRLWRFYGVHTAVMAVFSGWLIYLQAVVIGAFCQYCLVSAGTSLTLFVLFLISLAFRRRDATLAD